MPSRKLKVTLTLSPIGLQPSHVRTIEALGLRRIRATVVHEDTAVIRGMIAQRRRTPSTSKPVGSTRTAAGSSRPKRPEDEGAFRMKLGDLRPPRGARKPRKRVGRGPGSGHGKTSTKGPQGPQGALRWRQGPGFEGGQMPLYRRIPKRGFKNPFHREFAVINVSDLARCFPKGGDVGPRLSSARGCIGTTASRLVKVLADGELAAGTALTVRAPRLLEGGGGQDRGGGRSRRGAAGVIEVLQNLQNVTKIPELKRRLLVTAGLLAAYRLGAHVPTPGVDAAALARFFDSVQGTLLGLVDLFSGGNLRSLTVFALGIMPYISASIILQLLTVVVPALGAPGQGGEAGRKKITQYTRYGTIVLSAFQSLFIAIGLESMDAGGVTLVPNKGWAFRADHDDDAHARGPRSSCGSASRSPRRASGTASR